MRRGLAWIALVTTVALIFGAGCGDDDSADPPADTATESAEATMPVATVDIDPITGLPRTFPGEFPVLDGTTVARASEYADRYVIEWRGEGTYEDARAFYEQALSAEPWALDSTSDDEAATVFEFSGGTTAAYIGTLAVARFEDGSRILLELHPEGAD